MVIAASSCYMFSLLHDLEFQSAPYEPYEKKLHDLEEGKVRYLADISEFLKHIAEYGNCLRSSEATSSFAEGETCTVLEEVPWSHQDLPP